MTQNEKWLERYTEVKDFIETNHRNPSLHRFGELLMMNFTKHYCGSRTPGVERVEIGGVYGKVGVE